jgi:hypothetical protein
MVPVIVSNTIPQGKIVANICFSVWFAALYGINPTGMKALGNPESAPVLQKLAWDLLQKEPLRGTVATKG